MKRLFVIRHFVERLVLGKTFHEPVVEFIRSTEFMRCARLVEELDSYQINRKRAIIVSSQIIFRARATAQMISLGTGIEHRAMDCLFEDIWDMKEAKELLEGEFADFDDIVVVGHQYFCLAFPPYILQVKEAAKIDYSNGHGSVADLVSKTVEQIQLQK